MTGVSAVAAMHVGRVAGLHKDSSVLSDVRAAHVPQPRQRDGAAGNTAQHVVGNPT